jgi:hypothetical protein
LEGSEIKWLKSIDRHNFNDLRKLLERIDHEVLKPQRERGGLEMKLSFLDKFRKDKNRGLVRPRKNQVAFRKGLEFRKILLHIGAQIVRVLIS